MDIGVLAFLDIGEKISVINGRNRKSMHKAVSRLRWLALSSQHGGPGLGSGQPMWDLWWTEWHWERFLSEFFGFLLCIIPLWLSILIYYLGNEQ
jgi:hypothetical protein